MVPISNPPHAQDLGMVVTVLRGTRGGTVFRQKASLANTVIIKTLQPVMTQSTRRVHFTHS